MDWASEIVKSGCVCSVCGGSINRFGTPQLAHRIANTKPNRAKYGAFFVDHSLNLVPTCSLNCNQACNIGYNSGAVLQLLADVIMYEIRRFSNGKES